MKKDLIQHKAYERRERAKEALISITSPVWLPFVMVAMLVYFIFCVLITMVYGVFFFPTCLAVLVFPKVGMPMMVILEEKAWTRICAAWEHFGGDW